MLHGRAHEQQGSINAHSAARNAEAIRTAARRLAVLADTLVKVGEEIGPRAAMLATVLERAELPQGP